MPKAKITDALLKAPTGEKEVEVYDTVAPGLIVRLYPPTKRYRRGRKVYYVRYRSPIDGRHRRAKLGVYPEVSLVDARERARDYRGQKDRGVDPVHEAAKEEVPTFREVWMSYRDHLQNRPIPKVTWPEDERKMNVDLLPEWGDLPADKVNRRMVRAKLRYIAERRGSPVSRNRTLALIASMYNWALSEDLLEGILTVSPCQGIKMLPEQPRTVALDWEQIRTLWEWLEEQDTVPARAMQMVLISGCRRGEVLGAEWGELDDDGWWTIPAARIKTNKRLKRNHRVYLGAPLAQSVLERLPGGGQYLFPSPREGRYRDIRKVVMAARVVLGDHDWSTHDLRGTYITRLLEIGIPEILVSELVNHSRRTVTGRVYNQYAYDKEKRAAMETWDTRLRIELGMLEDERKVVNLESHRLGFSPIRP